MVKGVEPKKRGAKASGAYPVEVRGFESHPPHQNAEKVLRSCV